MSPGAGPRPTPPQSVFRPRDLAARGISPEIVRTWMRQGRVERVGQGLYRPTEHDPSELDTVAHVAAVVPRGVVCLLSALRLHEIGTESPPDVWIAIPSRATRPSTRGLPIRFVWFSPAMMRYGIEQRVADGVPFRVTSPVRTVVDCFRYRNKLGLSVALEALTDVLRDKRATVPEILRAAEVGRVRRVILPYLDAVLSR